MAVRRIRAYQDQPLQAGMEVQLDQRVSHHWLQVLRLPAGTEVWLFNGAGVEYPGRLLVHGRGRCGVLLQPPQAVQGNARPRLTLYQGIARGERMDFVLQKTTELGVDEIVPLQSQHSQLRVPVARLQKRMQHWQQIIISACEQCGRASLPRLLEPQPVTAVQCANDSCVRRWLLHPAAPTTLATALGTVSAATALELAVGPEGGFSAAELRHFSQVGFEPVNLGNNVLRTETAALAAVALVKLSPGLADDR